MYFSIALSGNLLIFWFEMFLSVGFSSKHFKIPFYLVFWICFCCQVKDPFAIFLQYVFIIFFLLAILLRKISVLFIARNLIIMWFKCHLCCSVFHVWDYLKFVFILRLKIWFLGCFKHLYVLLCRFLLLLEIWLYFCLSDNYCSDMGCS